MESAARKTVPSAVTSPFTPPILRRTRTLSKCMVSLMALHRTSRRLLVKPVVVLAAKCLGPGPLRLQMVRLAHELGGGDRYFEAFYGRGGSGGRPGAGTTR